MSNVHARTPNKSEFAPEDLYVDKHPKEEKSDLTVLGLKRRHKNRSNEPEMKSLIDKAKREQKCVLSSK